jgi:hypothetical protein
MNIYLATYKVINCSGCYYHLIIHAENKKEARSKADNYQSHFDAAPPLDWLNPKAVTPRLRLRTLKMVAEVEEKFLLKIGAKKLREVA